MSVSIRIDSKALQSKLDGIVAKQQFPFALSLAINQTGLQFQQAERQRLASLFTLRRQDFIFKQGVKRLGPAATKRNPSVTFGVDPKASFLDKFEFGGLKKPTGGTFLALPTDVKRNKRDIITAGNRPKALIQRLADKKGTGGVFVLKVQRGKLAPGIYQRTARGVKELFAFERDAKTPKVLEFADTFQKIVRTNFPANFDKALAQAIATAK